MKIIRWPESPEPAGRDRRALLFGVGMIGSAVCRALSKTGALEVRDVPFSWSDRHLQRKQATEIDSLCPNNPAGLVDIVWSAGSASFSATAPETARERETFENVLELAESLSTRTKVRFHLVSSAGGLFEGQICVSEKSAPCPRREYGELKLAQEELLRSSSRVHSQLRAHIYRPSTVYGPYRKGTRAGLVSTLFLNGISHSVTTIFGEPTTLRDMLWVDDLARHMAGRVTNHETEPSSNTVELIASCRPYSIFELMDRVEKILNTNLYVSYVKRFSNGMDITYLESAVPAGLRTNSVEQGLHLVYLSILGKSAAIKAG